MKNNERMTYGIIITVIIYSIANIFGKYFNSAFEIIPKSFGTHTIMLLLSIFTIFVFRQSVEFRISLPSFKKILKPILIGILTTIVVNFIMVIITKISGNNIETMKLLSIMTPFQVFIFIFIYASIAEEVLFRGFLLNFLKPLNKNEIIIFNMKISIPVIISAIMFGLAHLILITTGANFMFIIRIVIFASILGLIAGYYQEKYENNAYAIIVHMSGNLMGLLSSILMNH